ncbi:MAG TPA: hypothetical protein VFF40_11305 [Acidimicrobiia bacterium]|nr:hypothetical protein [Acidimicrobiia bacterium]
MSVANPSSPDDTPATGGVSEPGGPAGPAGEPRACELCGSRLGAVADRCGVCGMITGVIRPAPSPFSHGLLWVMAGGVLAIYLLVLALVAALR